MLSGLVAKANRKKTHHLSAEAWKNRSPRAWLAMDFSGLVPVMKRGRERNRENRFISIATIQTIKASDQHPMVAYAINRKIMLLKCNNSISPHKYANPVKKEKWFRAGPGAS